MTHRYEVRVSGRVDRTLAAEFAEMELATTVEHVQTVLHGEVEDQAALYGLLRRLEALGLDLIEVRRSAVQADGGRVRSPAEGPQSSSS